MRMLGLAAATIFVLGPLLALLRIVPAMVGFILFALGGALAVIAALASIVGLVRGRGLRPGGAVAIVVAIAFIALAARGRGVPAINDFTTDPADPPAFRDAAASGRKMDYPAGFAAIQADCCADLHPARLQVPPADAFARARTVAERMPRWTITRTDANAGVIEAIATSRLFGFHDDIVIRVRPDGASGSRVDVRSKSRDGRGDFGVNAARIRAFVAELERS